MSSGAGPWELYKKQPGFVLGFHGCDSGVGEALLSGKERHLKPSSNDYDWLGDGIYFWEGNPERALQFAKQAASENPKVSKGSIKRPFVIGAVIDLGLCCNLLDSSALAELQQAYHFLEQASSAAGTPLPVNRGPERQVRFLDRAVIQTLHSLRANGATDPEGPTLPPYDSVRAAFFEGGELFPGAGFSAKAHIQIAVRNSDCIKGYFRPLRAASRA
jgi:hypothetical protein